MSADSWRTNYRRLRCKIADDIRARADFGINVIVILLGIAVLIHIDFRAKLVLSSGGDSLNHVAIVEGALEEIRELHAIAISTNKIRPGVEYPYYLFANSGFYVTA